MLQNIKCRWLYFSLVALSLLTALFFSVFTSKSESFILLNSFHINWLDYFFITYTFLGDGTFCILCIIAFLFFKRSKLAITLLLGYISSGLIAQIFKKMFAMPRPKVFFEQNSLGYHHYIDGITATGLNSFPSGHTTSAFCFATILILVFRKDKLSVLFFTLAVLVAYSRIYLAQHFLQDVLFGAFLGSLFGLLCYHLVYRIMVYKSRKPSRAMPATAI